MDRQRTGIGMGLLILVAAAAVVYDGLHLWHASRINRAIEQIEAGESVSIDHARVRFARAFALQQNGDFDETLRAYAAVGAREGDVLHRDVEYNLANLYFRRALHFHSTGADDLAFPLIQLAKETYRNLLREDSQNWYARYNLELALRLAPEMDPLEAREERNPEHNPRAAAGIRIRRALP